MSVLIGITSKNRVNILPKAIQSSLEQTYSDKIIEVFDDASNDGTKNLAGLYPQVNWHFSEITKGYLYARNLFLQNTKADYFVGLDDDAWFLQNNTIKLAIEYIETNEDVAAIAFDILSPYDNNQDKSITTFVPVETNMFIGCGHLVNCKIINRLGNYTTNPGYYGGEEKDLCLRIINAGYRIIKLKGLYVWHAKTTIARDLLKQHRSGVCNDLVFTYRRVPSVIFIPLLGYKFFSHLKFSLTYKKANFIEPCIKGFYDFFKFCFTKTKQRNPVSLRVYRKFLRLNKTK